MRERAFFALLYLANVFIVILVPADGAHVRLGHYEAVPCMLASCRLTGPWRGWAAGGKGGEDGSPLTRQHHHRTHTQYIKKEYTSESTRPWLYAIHFLHCLIVLLSCSDSIIILEMRRRSIPPTLTLSRGSVTTYSDPLSVRLLILLTTYRSTDSDVLRLFLYYSGGGRDFSCLLQ